MIYPEHASSFPPRRVLDDRQNRLPRQRHLFAAVETIATVAAQEREDQIDSSSGVELVPNYPFHF